MKFFRLLTILLAAVLLTGCTKNQFKISFTLPGDVNQTYRVVYYASNSKGGILRETAVSIANGKGEITCPTVNPSMVYIFSYSSSRPLICYAEKGEEIAISGTKADPMSWSIDGNEIDRELTSWRLANEESLSPFSAAKINSAVAKYIEANPGNPVSAILLLNYFSRRDDEKMFSRLASKLTGDAANTGFFELTGRSDAYTADVIKPARIRALLLHTKDNGQDLVRTDSAPTLLYFWNRDNDNHKTAVDSLKALSVEFRDSTSRNIAYICMEPDSLSWQNASRSDSLRKVVNAWMPLGFADRRMMSMGVGRTPFFIVTDLQGVQIYRGESPAEASSAFRKLMKK